MGVQGTTHIYKRTTRASSNLRPSCGVETFESSHRAFTTTFPRGFAIEILNVYCGPPQIVCKFRHWGYMEGPFMGHALTGDLIELFGITIIEMNENNKLSKIEFFYDRGELLGKLVKGEKVEAKDGEVASTCPIMRSTG
ncbi:pathogen-related protein-like [Humulus lupulus]|uniref:pathogen-related protein-like n=1 Tax=Humulus lupulus TaxID=3486 RepID=UPI002B411F12|nr:pathogen-related protein-like [Humulus lupulus]